MDNIGIHTPRRTAAVLKMINEVRSDIQFEDQSFINDGSDCIFNEEHDITIYVPSDDFDSYLIEFKDQGIETKNLNSVISVIKNIQKDNL